MPLKMAHTILLNLLQATILLSRVQVAEGVVYIVGVPAGWYFTPTASYYSDWASENTFVPGDKLSFRYDPTNHNVQQVNISDYATCNTLNPVKQYQSGHDLFTFEHPGTYCICGFAGHCEGGGMLIKLVVTGSTTTNSKSSPSTTPTVSTSSKSSSTPSAAISSSNSTKRWTSLPFSSSSSVSWSSRTASKFASSSSFSFTSTTPVAFPFPSRFSSKVVTTSTSNTKFSSKPDV